MSRAKRTLDLAVSAGGLVLIFPLLLVIALLIKAEDGGTVFFRHERVGRGGRRFHMWKFRTMVPNASKLGPELTVAGDRRITRVGAWLRRQKLDELPQLFNVLVGDMTLVGPRPEVPKYVAMYTPQQRTVLELAPGITDKASIAFADESTLLAAAPDPERFYVDQILPEKIRINLEYADRATPLRDVAVLLETLGQVVPLPRPKSSLAGESSSRLSHTL